MIADMLNNNKLNPVVTGLFIRGKKRIISLVFITKSYFAVPKNVILNCTNYFIMKFFNKQELQQIAFNQLSDFQCNNFMSLYKQFTTKPNSFLVTKATRASDNSSSFNKKYYRTNIKANYDNR